MNKKRIHNILFHLHTVSGIVVSVVLFIIFFAGAFTMFKEEIQVWERGSKVELSMNDVDFDKIYAELEEEYNLIGRNLNFSMLRGGNDIYVFVDHSHAPDASPEDLETHLLTFNISDYELLNYEEAYNYSEFLYRLHFLSQIPSIGIYLAGLVAFFFLFALLTGLYIHWDKIAKNFVLFRPHVKWNTIWKDAHTVLGTIAFPFQLMFAVTGAYFCLSTLVLLPAFNLYGNDYEKLMNDMRPERAHAEWQETTTQKPQSINQFLAENYDYFKDFEANQLSIENIGGTNMEYEFVGKLSDKVSFSGKGSYAVDAYSLNKLHEFNPYETGYTTRVQSLLTRLHFGDYGGVYIKTVYAFLAFLTCFIIISGVMLWLVSRDKKNVPEKRRKFNRKVVNVYLALCLSMIPVTAIGFMASKILPSDYAGSRQIYYYVVYFIVWLAMTIFFIIKNNFRFTLKWNVFLGGILFLLVPIFNGMLSGNWMWLTLNPSLHEIFIVDFFCLLLSGISLFAFSKIQSIKSS